MKQVIFSFLLSAFFLQAQAQSSYIDSIIAIVEDDVITNSELTKEVTRIRDEFSSKGKQLPPASSLNGQVLELLINKSILIQEAKSRGANVTDTQLNNTMENLAKRNKKTLAQFRKSLIASGLDYKAFREDVRNELIINSLKSSYIRQNTDVTDQEVDDFITRNGSDTNSLEYRLSHILIALPDGASTEQLTEARVKTNEIIQKLNNGENFPQLAAEYSAGSNAIEGGDLGWRKLAEIPSLFANIIQHIQVGEVSDVLRSASGFHIVKLTEQRDSEQLIVEQTHARHILIKPDKLMSNDQAKQKLESIREEFLAGADFTELAKKHSNDPGSKGLGGDLGWVQKGAMVPTFEKVLAATQTGESSEVFRSRFGWHFLQVLDRKKVDETEESKRKKVREQLQAQKQREVLELYQRRLRDQAFVKVIAES
ncbi:MAG: molecular chaperone SurA [Gammaproteobacteria bacterium]|jgi:peptidyl-prolyl cis-trans isomerase SurA|nr:molecular chaperone SurA [Gammaproteobacteria bacterium]MBT3724283.1 molecular chaperone SurA [Gammaproteobacteria bacterium]MBT4077003.1 molecular chaperone SurA [Gammaproteobacteria bacterium]MBT4196704.1 molecular chaperone SurA [Gammaproteobacteria bacterium]MBT4448526.1 molecular chaperone SurA [Gammaproteobacteria bacterium]